MIKQREKTRVTIFRLANTSLHEVYYEDHEITEYLSRYAVLLWEMMEVMMLMQVVMETGIVAKNNKIPFYASNFKREYLFIRGLNKYFKCFAKKLDLLNHGLFESNTSNTIKKYMKRFLREQEKGKFNDISKLIIPSYAIDIIRDITFISE